MKEALCKQSQDHKKAGGPSFCSYIHTLYNWSLCGVSLELEVISGWGIEQVYELGKGKIRSTSGLGLLTLM